MRGKNIAPLFRQQFFLAGKAYRVNAFNGRVSNAAPFFAFSERGQGNGNIVNVGICGDIKIVIAAAVVFFSRTAV